MHREHDDAIADDDDEDDVGDDVGGFSLSPERRPACSHAKALPTASRESSDALRAELRKRQRQLVRGFCRKDAAEAATQQCHALTAWAGPMSLSRESAGAGHSC